VEDRLKSLKDDGYEVVIGDVVTVEAAKQLGMNGVLITSGKEAVMESLDEARRVYQLFSKLHEEILVYQSIIDAEERLIGVVDDVGKLICANKQFHAEFSNEMIESTPELKEIIQSTYKRKTNQTKMLTLHNQLWNISTSYNENHLILFFETAFPNRTNVQEEDGGQYAVEVQTNVPHVLMSGKSKQIQEVMKQVEKYSRMDEPLWIIGETGNGKDTVAQSIYLKSKKNNELFITIHCDLLKEGQLKELLQENYFRDHANGIVYLKRIDRLDAYSQKKFYHYFHTHKGKLPRLIVSSNDEFAIDERDATIDHELFTLLGRLIIYIPPLRERVQDIENLIPVFISEFHSKYSKQIVGVRQEAMRELIEYDWPRNVDQLKQVIEQLVLHSNSYYLEKEEVSSVIALLKQRQEDEYSEHNQIEISGTLKDIEKRVITQVLEEEDMNQSKAAKRLGINRSTLWRKLKS
jgi:DNA-binding NtrC family response regulator